VERPPRTFLEQDHDLVVIGGGAAGRSAARAARWSGARVALVTDEALHCLAPSAFLAVAAPQGDAARAMANANRADTVASFAGSLDRLRKEGVDVVDGRARFVDPGEVEVEGRRLRSGRFVIATGSRPAISTITGASDVGALTPDDLWSLGPLPSSLAIVGAGATGCELAQVFARLGVRVTLLEQRERILPGEEAAAAAIIARALIGDGVDVRTGARVRSVAADRDRGGVRVTVDRGVPASAGRLLLATGRSPFTEGLHLDAAGVEVDAAGFIRVDAHLRTTARGTYAAGDVTGLLPNPHAAAEMGRLAAGHALKRGPRGPFRARWIPRVTFTDPEIATLGVFENDAPRWSRVAELPFAEVDRAVAEGRTDGYCKLIAGPRLPGMRLFGGRLIGATVVAPNAGDLIAEVTLAMRAGMFPARLAQAVHAYPTWSSAVQTCAAQFVVEVDGRRARRPHRA
jgi:pyruvate/2-oxoglutarate dehydrogenase complex dihydrolipoamide dehydrogenase (E3) component